MLGPHEHNKLMEMSFEFPAVLTDNGFLTGQQWHVLKSCYTSRGPEQGVWYCSVDGLNQSFVSFVLQANCCYISVFVTSADIILLFQHEKNGQQTASLGMMPM